jgi:PAS domain S-box-containing protein
MHDITCRTTVDMKIRKDHSTLTEKDKLFTHDSDLSTQHYLLNALQENEYRYVQLLQRVPVAIYTCDENGVVKLFNDAAVELWGGKPQPVAPLSEILKNGKKVFGQEITVERADGSRRTVVPYPQLMVGPAGKIEGAVNVLIDITEQKQRENDLAESEFRFHQFIQSLPAAVYTCDAGGYITLFNDAAAALWGRKPEIGKDLWCGSWKIFDTDGNDLPLDTCPMAIALREGRPVYGKEIVIERPDGVRVNVLPHPRPLFDAAGTLIGAVNMLVDISDIKRAGDALKESEERFRTMADQAPIVVWMADEEGNCSYINSKWSELTGKPYAEALGTGWLNFVHPDDQAGASLQWNSSFAERQPVTITFRHKKADSGYITANVSGSPRYNSQGRFVGYIGILRDVTLELEKKAYMEAEIRRATEELRQKNTELKNSEERFHRMVSEVQDYAIILLSKEGIIENWNKGAEKIKGYTVDEAIGKSFRIFYNDDDRQKKLPDQLIEEARRKGKATHEGWRVRKDGSRFWGGILITALHNDVGEVIGFSKVTRDLSEKKRADDALIAKSAELEKKNEELRQKNAELKNSEERFHRMVSEVQDYAIILLSKEGIIENWNKGAEKIKGYSTEEIVGKNFSIFYTPHDREVDLPGQLMKIAHQEGKATHEGWRVRKDGSKFWGSIVITALHNDAGEVIGFSKVTRDLTEKKLADDALRTSAAELQEKNRELEAMNQELASFAYVSSHDLQEPLRKIQTFASRILESEAANLSPKGKDYFGRMQNAALRMQTLIEDLLAYSRTNTTEKNFERVDLNVILEEVRNDLKEAIDEKKAVIISEPLPELDVVRFQFGQLLTNILGNAIKFSKPDSAPQIHITAGIVKGDKIPGTQGHADRSYHHIAIRDNGIGFEPEHKHKIFEVFQRLHGRTEYGGTGIGLAICKKIMDNHKGIITAESEPDQGATFHLFFPA